jgi:hypothetical protein
MIPLDPFLVVVAETAFSDPGNHGQLYQIEEEINN